MKHTATAERVAIVRLLWQHEKAMKEELASKYAKENPHYKYEIQGKLDMVQMIIRDIENDEHRKLP